MADIDAQENFDLVIQFEPDYENIKIDRNKIWDKYEPKIMKLTKSLAYWKNFDKDELLQQTFLYFVELCEAYDPYYMNRFYPFDRYLFKNLIIKLRAFIQRFYVKSNREKPSEFTEFLLQNETTDNVKEATAAMYNKYIYSLLSKRQADILKLTLSGYKQQEIGKKLKISQSRVSVIKKKTIEDLQNILDETHTQDEKDKIKMEQLRDLLYE